MSSCTARETTCYSASTSYGDPHVVPQLGSHCNPLANFRQFEQFALGNRRLAGNSNQRPRQYKAACIAGRNAQPHHFRSPQSLPSCAGLQSLLAGTDTSRTSSGTSVLGSRHSTFRTTGIERSSGTGSNRTVRCPGAVKDKRHASSDQDGINLDDLDIDSLDVNDPRTEDIIREVKIGQLERKSPEELRALSRRERVVPKRRKGTTKNPFFRLGDPKKLEMIKESLRKKEKKGDAADLAALTPEESLAALLKEKDDQDEEIQLRRRRKFNMLTGALRLENSIRC
jgi:hypothetical protein